MKKNLNVIDIQKDDNNFRELIEPANIIKQGGIVVFPTETVYGIGTNGLDKNAVENLYKIKQRSFNKPISLIVSSMEMVEMVARDITCFEYKLMEKFFPGPLTIILKKKSVVPDILTANGDTIGIRMPSMEIARKLSEISNVPIAAPSANISGNKSGVNIQSIVNDFGDKVDYYIDGGESKLGIGSTIVKLDGNNIKILRRGSITEEQLYEVLKD